MIDRTVPTTVVIEGLEWSFAQCVAHVVDTNPQFRGRAGAFMAERILEAIEGKAEGDAFQWKDKDWKALDEAMNAPAAGYCPDAYLNGKPVAIGARHFTKYLLTVSGDENG